MRITWNLKKTLFSPLSSKGVFSNKVFVPILNSPSNQTNNMIKIFFISIVMNYTPFVFIKLFWKYYCTHNRPPIFNFSFHRFYIISFKKPSTVNFISLIILQIRLRKTFLRSIFHLITILALLCLITRLSIIIESCIWLTGFIEISLRHPKGEWLPSTTTITATSLITVHYSLWRKGDLRKCIISHNIYSIWYKWSSYLCPTTSAIDRKKLLLNSGNIICPVNISPIPLFRQIRSTISLRL